MNSKEALERLEDNGKEYLLPVRVYKLIKQDLERLEQLEIANKNNEGLVRENVDLINRNLKLQFDLQTAQCIAMSSTKENAKLKQALEKSCERLDYTCPVEEELIDDLDCENCKFNRKECWKKFFLKSDLEEKQDEK